MASSESYLPRPEAHEARRATSPTYVDGPISSLTPPESAWRPAGHDPYWQRPYIGYGLPTSYHHERPTPRFAEPQLSPYLPKFMRPDYVLEEALPSSSPLGRFIEQHQNYSCPGPTFTKSRSDSGSGPRFVEPPSSASFKTSGSIDRLRTTSNATDRSPDTSLASLFAPRSRIGRLDDSLDYNTSVSTGFSPKVITQPLPPSQTKDHLKASARAGPSRSPLLSPIAASSSPGEFSAFSRSSPNLAAKDATDQTYHHLQQLRREEAKSHRIDASGYLEPYNGCQSIFLPKPRLRTQSVDNFHRQRGIFLPEATQHSQSQALDNEGMEQLSDHPVQSRAHQPSYHISSRSSSLRGGASAGTLPNRQHARQLTGSTLQTEPPHAVPDRDSSVRTQHARANSSGFVYDSDTDASTSATHHTRSFFHHRMPPKPPVTDDRGREGRMAGKDVSYEESSKSRRQSEPFPHTPALTDQATEDKLNDDEQVLDIPTVLEQGRRLEKERRAWRREYERSLGSGFLSSRRSKDKSQSGRRRAYTDATRNIAPTPLQRLFDDLYLSPPVTARDTLPESVWMDERTGRSYLIREFDQDRHASLRFSKSFPHLAGAYGGSDRSSFSPDPAMGLCAPLSWCTLTPHRQPKLSKESTEEKGDGRPSQRRRAFSLHNKAEKAVLKKQERKPVPQDLLGRPVVQSPTGRNVVSDEPVVIGRRPPDQFAADSGYDEKQGGANAGPLVGLAISTPSDKGKLMAEDDIREIFSFWTTEKRPPSLPPGRYPTQGYHRPSNSGEIRAQLSSSRSSSLSRKAVSSTRHSSSYDHANSPKRYVPPLPSLPTGAHSIDSRHSRDPLASPRTNRNSYVPDEAEILYQPNEQQSLPVPPCKTSSMARRDISGASYPYPTSVAGSSNESVDHKPQEVDHVPISMPFQMPMLKPEEQEVFSSAAARDSDEARERQQAYGPVMTAQPSESGTPVFAAWRDSLESEIIDSEPTIAVGESPQRRHYVVSSDDNELTIRSTRASSDAHGPTEVWNANNVSIENLFFRRPA